MALLAQQSYTIKRLEKSKFDVTFTPETMGIYSNINGVADLTDAEFEVLVRKEGKELFPNFDESLGGRNYANYSLVGRYSGGSVTTQPSIIKNSQYKHSTNGNPADIMGFISYPLPKGKITISCKSDLESFNIYYNIKYSDGTQTGQISLGRKILIDGVFNLTIDNPEDNGILNIGLGQYPFVRDYWVAYVKVEKGTISTDWTPAPEDILTDAVLTTHNCTAAVVGSKLKITTITPGANAGWVDALISYGTGFSQKKRFTWTRIVDTKEALDDLEIGTKNLASIKYIVDNFTFTNKHDYSTGWMEIDNWVAHSETEFQDKDVFGIVYEPNTQYTITGYAKRLENDLNTGLVVIVHYTDSTIQYTIGANQDSELKQIFITEAGKTIRRIGFTYSNSGISRLKIAVKKGTHDKDWSIAPEDIQARIEAEKLRLDEIFNDDIADPSEKQFLKQKWQEINGDGTTGEFHQIISKAGLLNVSDAILDNFSDAFDMLNIALSPVLANMAISTNLGVGGGANLRNLFEAYYKNKAIIQNAIAEKSAEKAVNDLEIGGKSYIRNGNFLAGTNDWGLNAPVPATPPIITAQNGGVHVPDWAMGALKVVTAQAGAGIWQDFTTEHNQLELNRPYTLSFALKKDMPGTLNILFGSETQSTHTRTITVNNEWQRHELTFTPTTHKNMVFYALNAGTFYIANIALHKGTKRQPFRNGYLDEALKVDGEVNGGLTLSSVIAARNAQRVVRSYMSGIDSNPTAFAAGVESFGEGNETRMIELNHDGSWGLAGKKLYGNKEGDAYLGVFEIGADGIIRIMDTVDQELVRMLIHRNPLQSVFDLLSDAIDTATLYPANVNFNTLQHANVGTFIMPSTHNLIKNDNKITVNLNLAASCDEETGGGGGITPQPGSSATIYLYRKNGAVYEAYSFVGSISTEPGFTNSSVISKVIQNVPAGEYRLGITYGIYPSGYVNATGISFKYEHSNIIRRTEFGKDGFMMFYNVGDSKNFFHMTETGGLRVGGATDMPGVLASGSVASNANHSNIWGAKASSSSYATKGDGAGQNDGIFNVPHNIGNTNYTVMATATQDNINVRVIGKYANSIRVSTRNTTNAYVNGSFDYTIIGNN